MRKHTFHNNNLLYLLDHTRFLGKYFVLNSIILYTMNHNLILTTCISLNTNIIIQFVFNIGLQIITYILQLQIQFIM